jgi:hypothetical protein
MFPLEQLLGTPLRSKILYNVFDTTTNTPSSLRSDTLSPCHDPAVAHPSPGTRYIGDASIDDREIDVPMDRGRTSHLATHDVGVTRTTTRGPKTIPIGSRRKESWEASLS